MKKEKARFKKVNKFVEVSKIKDVILIINYKANCVLPLKISTLKKIASML